MTSVGQVDIGFTPTLVIHVPATSDFYLTFVSGLLVFLGTAAVTVNTGFRFYGTNAPLTLHFPGMFDLYAVAPLTVIGSPVTISYLLNT